MFKKALFFIFCLMFVWGSWAWSRENLVPNLTFYTFQGQKLSFQKMRGKVVLINFFATYCPPCQVELVEFSQLYKEWHPQGLEIVSFMVDQQGKVLLPHLIASRGINYPVAVADESILAAFGWPDILPTTFVVDKDGRIVRKIIGFAGKATLERTIKSLLQEKS